MASLLLNFRANATPWNMKHEMRCVDIRKMIQPFAFLVATQAFSELGEGEILEILMDAEEEAEELYKVLPERRFEVVGMNAESGHGGGIALRLIKLKNRGGAAGGGPQNPDEKDKGGKSCLKSI